MLSRAKHGMYILGHADTLTASKKSTMWRQVSTSLQTHHAHALRCQVRALRHVAAEDLSCDLMYFAWLHFNGTVHRMMPTGHDDTAALCTVHGITHKGTHPLTHPLTHPPT